MTVLIYDGSWIGLLCCVYEIYEKKFNEVSIVKEQRFQPDAFATIVKISSDELHARRVWAGLSKRISKNSMSHIYSCYLSEIPHIENIVCGFMRLAFDSTESPEKAYANPTVLRVSQVEKMVHREKHRMEAFIRFQLTKDQLYFATVEPDFNVLPLIARHFKNRYADQRWLILDLKRNYGIYYDLHEVTEVVIDNSGIEKKGLDLFSEDELLYQMLWKVYFTHVNISERKNNKLHLMHVPKRYWKHLTEKLVN